MIPPNLANQFWMGVKKGQNPDDCWEWVKGRYSTGYGMFTRAYMLGFPRLTHRFSYMLHYGPIPEKMQVCHKCDNPACVNPHHLFLGTPSDNMQDCVQKGRHFHLEMRGEKHWKARLSEVDVIAIRNDNRPLSVISKAYGCSKTHISHIKRRTIWGHIP